MALVSGVSQDGQQADMALLRSLIDSFRCMRHGRLPGFPSVAILINKKTVFRIGRGAQHNAGLPAVVGNQALHP